MKQTYTLLIAFIIPFFGICQNAPTVTKKKTGGFIIGFNTSRSQATLPGIKFSETIGTSTEPNFNGTYTSTTTQNASIEPKMMGATYEVYAMYKIKNFAFGSGYKGYEMYGNVAFDGNKFPSFIQRMTGTAITLRALYLQPITKKLQLGAGFSIAKPLNFKTSLDATMDVKSMYGYSLDMRYNVSENIQLTGGVAFDKLSFVYGQFNHNYAGVTDGNYNNNSSKTEYYNFDANRGALLNTTIMQVQVGISYTLKCCKK